MYIFKFGIWLWNEMFNFFHLKDITYVMNIMKFLPKKSKNTEKLHSWPWLDLELDLWSWLATYIIYDIEAVMDDDTSTKYYLNHAANSQDMSYFVILYIEIALKFDLLTWFIWIFEKKNLLLFIILKDHIVLFLLV